MSSEEFTEWQIIYDTLEPFGEWRADMRAGNMISPLVNLLKIHIYKEPELTTPDKWIMDFARPPEPQQIKPQSQEEIQSVFKAIAGVL